MRILLDTHVFLWYITADSKLPAAFQAAIQNPENEVYLSSASVWEAVIKHRLGKLLLPNPPEDYLPRQRDAHGIASLSIDEQAMTYLAVLPTLHRDPFDRIIIAQSLQHGLTIASVDLDIARYPAALLVTS